MDISSFLWGAAIGIIGALATGFLKKAGEDAYAWLKKKINPKSAEPSTSHLIVHLDSSQPLNTTEAKSSETSQHPVIERVSIVTVEEINTALSEAPPLQRDRVAERYTGLHVEWDTKFIGGKIREDEKIQLHLKSVGGREESVWCEVPAAEYRELGILPKNAKIQVSGEITKIASYGIELKDARLHIYSLPRSA